MERRTLASAAAAWPILVASALAQDFVHLREQLDRAKQAAQPCVVVLSQGDADPQILQVGTLPKEVGGELVRLPLDELSPIALLCVLEQLPADSGIDLDKPIGAIAAPGFADLDLRLLEPSMAQLLAGHLPHALPAFRELGADDERRSMAEFVATHAFATRGPLEGEYPGRSDLPAAMVQHALEHHFGVAFANWCGKAAAKTSLPSLRVGGAAPQVHHDSEVDAAADLTLALEDVPALLRWLRAPTAPGRPTGLHTLFNGDHRSGAAGSRSCLLMEDGDLRVFAWCMANGAIDPWDVQRAVVHDLDPKSDESALALGGGMGGSFTRAKVPKDGSYRASWADLGGTHEVVIVPLLGSLRIRELPDGEPQRMTRALFGHQCRFALANGTQAQIDVTPVDDTLEGHVLVLDGERSALPYRLHFTKS